MNRPLILVLAAIVGCSRPGPPPAPEPVTVTAEGKAVAAANNRFAFDFYGKLREKPGNVFVSPLSLHAALSMTAAGANGQTLAEMRKVLHLPAAPDAGYANLLAAAVGDRPGYQLRTANAVWGQTGYPWRPTFTGRLTAGFGAPLKEADFQMQPDAERLRINAWAEEQTSGRIKDLIAEGMIDARFRMVLVNAVYFKGEWAEQFDAKRTRPAPFTRSDGSKADVPMMNREGGFRVFAERSPGAWEPNFWVAELPYKGGEVSLVLVVPGRPDGLLALETRLSPEVLDGWLAAAVSEERAELALPKFKLETKYLEMASKPGPLHALGMPTAFDPGRTDFTAMHSGTEQLYIAFVVQKAFVEVNEEGTVAAAATAVGVSLTSASPSYRADRPFRFLIRHNPTGAILFLGRYAGP